LQKTQLPQDILQLSPDFPEEESLGSQVQEIYDKLRANIVPAEIEDIELRWWKNPPVPPDNHITLVFTDVTADHTPVGCEGPWQIQEIQASLDELFYDAFLRFRLEANKKHRHPFLPSLSFSMLLAQTPVEIHVEDSITVKEVVEQLGQPVVSYIRHDKDRQYFLADNPFSAMYPWLATFPAWFSGVSPSHWMNPTPPPSYESMDELTLIPSFPKPVRYFKVPLLKFGGNGRNILPSVSHPPFIVSDIYLPVVPWHPTTPHDYKIMRLDVDLDLVRPSDILIPPISTEQAKSLLGRVIRYCRHPLVINEPGKKKKKQKSDPYEFALAWGWDPDTCELHCFNAPIVYTPFLLDLREPLSMIRNTLYSDPDPYAMSRTCCQWLAVVTTAEDRWVLEQLENPHNLISRPQAPTTAESSSSDERLTDIVMQLNASPRARIFEVRSVILQKLFHAYLPYLGHRRLFPHARGYHARESAARL
jgi:hypothetical protein